VCRSLALLPSQITPPRLSHTLNQQLPGVPQHCSNHRYTLILPRCCVKHVFVRNFHLRHGAWHTLRLQSSRTCNNNRAFLTIASHSHHARSILDLLQDQNSNYTIYFGKRPAPLPLSWCADHQAIASADVAHTAMRLLNVNTRQLEEFFGDAIPLYAILSHTWGAQEVTFQDLAKEGHEQKQGYSEIEGCCPQAASQSLLYVWIDTCCIDKTSSAELSEAINSMFHWYAAARVCYVYLQDVPPGLDPFDRNSAFQTSRWFTRGWTLQELIAPGQIEFYASDWTPIFPLYTRGMTGPGWLITHRKKIALLSGITRIPESVLRQEYHLSLVSAACKFSWAADQRTTRIEDEAYSLLGLLGINMSLLYGEGNKAFLRLQEIVLSSSDDISVPAWGYDLSWKFVKDEYQASILARSPKAFLGIPRANIRHTRRTPKVHTTLTGHGLHIELSMVNLDAPNKVWLGIIEEELRYHESIQVRQVGIAIVLKQRTGMKANIFERAGGCPPIRIFERHLRRRFKQITTRN
jgi:hypothetical protein